MGFEFFFSKFKSVFLEIGKQRAKTLKENSNFISSLSKIIKQKVKLPDVFYVVEKIKWIVNELISNFYSKEGKRNNSGRRQLVFRDQLISISDPVSERYHCHCCCACADGI